METLSYWAGMAGTVAFAVTAVLAVAPRGVDIFGVAVLGIITAIGGGLIRDVLAGRQNLLMTREIYAIPVLLGCTLYVVLLHLVPDNWIISAGVGFTLIFGLRAAAIHWDLSVPDWLATGPKAGRNPR